MKIPIVTPAWFVRKTYGWGRTPGTRQWWLVTAVLLGGIIRFASYMSQQDLNIPTVRNQYILGMSILILSLLLISYLTGEKPKRQWGKKNNNSKQDEKI